MSVVIRLKRMGTIKKPFNRIVVCDTRTPRDGRSVEELGFYDPSKEPYLLEVNQERILYWLSKGARISDTVKSLLKKTGIFSGDKK